MEAKDLQDGYYDARPTCWGLTETKNGVPQYAIEFEVTVQTEAGPEAVSVLHKQGFGNDKGFEILVEQLRVCGWQGSDFNTVELDATKSVRINIGRDDYGVKVKGVYGQRSAVERYALKDDKKQAAVAELNQRLRAMGLAAPATSTASVAHPAHPSNAAPKAAPAQRAAQAPAAARSAAPQTAPQAAAPQAAQRPAPARPQRPAQPRQAPQEEGGWFPGNEPAPEETPF